MAHCSWRADGSMPPAATSGPEGSAPAALRAIEHFSSVAELLTAVPADEVVGQRRVRLTNLTLLDKRMVSKDKLCFFTVSDRAMGPRKEFTVSVHV